MAIWEKGMVAAAVMGVLWIWTAHKMGQLQERFILSEAIHHGCAEYVVKDSLKGTTEFRWKGGAK